jgi:hypothetical protein
MARHTVRPSFVVRRYEYTYRRASGWPSRPVTRPLRTTSAGGLEIRVCTFGGTAGRGERGAFRPWIPRRMPQAGTPGPLANNNFVSSGLRARS